MATWVWIVIAVAAVVVLALVLWNALRARRTRTLREGFGPEYDRTVADAPSKREAEAELAERDGPTTEDLRVAMQHYRSLFDELLGETRQPAGAENPR